AAVTLRTSLLDAEKALLHPHLTVTATGGARHRLGSGLGAAAVTRLAGVPGWHPDGGVETVGRLFQRDFQVVAQIRAAIHLRTAAAAAARSAAAENVAEDIAKGIGKATGAASTAAAH